MLTVIRKNQSFLTPVIVALTIISFIWLYSRTNLSQVGANDVARVYGSVLQRAQVERLAREYQLAMALGMTDFVRDLGGFSENEEKALTDFIFNDLVIEHESSRLGVVPSNEAVATVIQSLPLFQTQGVFDPSKYESFIKERFAARGFTEQQLEEVVRDSLCLKKVREIITSPVAISEAQVRNAARIYQQVSMQLLRFDRDTYLKEVKSKALSSDEKKAYYEKNKGSFVSDEKRAVNYVIFELTPEQKKLQGKERVQAMQQISDAAAILKQKAEEKGNEENSLEKAAVENGRHSITTVDFNRQGSQHEAKGSKQEQEAPVISPSLLSAAFKLAKVGALSEVIQVGQSFYLLSLVRLVPSHPLEFAAVESSIETLLYEQKAEQKMKEIALKSVQSIHQAMAEGKNFSDAAKLAGVTPVLLTGMSPSEAALKKVPLPQRIFLNASLSLKEGELSDLKHASWGDFAVYLQSRSPLSSVDWKEHHEEIEKDLLEQQRTLLFLEWLQTARNEAKIEMLERNHQKQGGLRRR